MEKENQKKYILPWIIVGILVLALIGGGIYVYRDLNQATAQKQPNNPLQAAMQNPALRTATSLLRLQQSPDLALNSDQKTKLIPIVQELIDNTSPTTDFQQQKADAIKAVLTTDQKKFLDSAQSSGQFGGGGQGNPNRRRQNQTDSSGQADGTNSQGTDEQQGTMQPGNGQQGGQRGQYRQGGVGQAQNIYQRVLDMLQQ